MIEQIISNDQVLAIIIRSSYQENGIHFFTPDSFSQQLGYMNRPKGYVIAPHDHNPVPRVVTWTQEVIVIKEGKVRLDLYGNNRNYLESRILFKGDVALLAHGGHGLEMLEQSEIIEVKQGPYAGEEDKTRFEMVSEESLKVKGVGSSR